MADSYTQFSLIFRVKGLKAKKWIEDILTNAEKQSSIGDEVGGGELLDVFPNWNDKLRVGFDWEFKVIQPGKKQAWVDMWIYSEGEGDVEQVADFIQAYLKKFDTRGKVGFEYAHTCSSPRVGEFGGGACVVTPTKVRWNNTNHWLGDELGR